MLSWISKIMLKLWGFEVKGDLSFNDEGKKSVLVVIPHTHWKDFPLGILVKTAHHLHTKFLAKSELFEPWYGFIFKKLGGYPVYRKSRNAKFVDSVIDIFNEHETFSITITPEGTRKKVSKLKTGYYHIAKGAGAMIIPTIFDAKNKQVVFLDPFYPTDDTKADLETLDKILCGYTGFVPEYSYDCN